MWLVAADCRQKEESGKREGATTLKAVMVEGWLCIGIYRSPEEKEQINAGIVMNELMVKKQYRGNWIVCGDFNEESDNSTLAAIAEFHGGTDVGGMRGEATRWEGRARIDWFMTNNTGKVSEMRKVPYGVSDHKPLTVDITLEEKRRRCKGALAPTSNWGKPVGMERKNGGLC